MRYHGTCTPVRKSTRAPTHAPVLTQVNWTKWSAPGSGTGTRRPDTRRETDSRLKIRASRAGGTLWLHFCSADEDKAEKLPDSAPEDGSDGDGGDGDGGAEAAKGSAPVGGAATPYAEIASILQVNNRGLDRRRRWWWESGKGVGGTSPVPAWRLFGGAADAAAATAAAAMAQAFCCVYVLRREGSPSIYR